MHQHKEENLKQSQDKTNEVIDELQKYMLYNSLVTEFNNKYKNPTEQINYIKVEKVEKVDKLEKLEKVEPILLKSNHDFFYPEQKDQLFWCYYIIKNGFAAYEYPGTTSYANEKKEKFECIELLRKNKQTLKENKIKNIKEDVEDELGSKIND